MIYREKSDTDLYAEHLRDIVLKRQSTLGPWLVMGLFTTLTLFLAYLVFSNLIQPVTVVASPERSLRMMNQEALMTATTLPDQPPSALAPPWTPAATNVPQSRASHALVGGEGPALLSTELSATLHAGRFRRDVH